MEERLDVVVVGAGLVGLAVAERLLAEHPGLRLAVLEKERRLARHQSGRNSGVIHSGLYYVPGSAKARNCRRGRALLLELCQAEGIDHELCGKLVVATDPGEVEGLDALAQRGRANGVQLQRVDGPQIAEREPHCRGLAGLWVEDTGIVDYDGVARALRRRIEAAGGQIRLDQAFLRREPGPGLRLATSTSTLSAGLMLNCAGLFSDRVARACGVDPDLRIVPFRGEYFLLRPEAQHLCRGLIYPVPNPEFPFLGVHLTRRIDGSVECGPNAVLALAREGYTRGTVNLADLAETLGFIGFRRLIRRHLRRGLAELLRAGSRHRFARALGRFIPQITPEDLIPSPAGVRAQAVRRNGQLEDDFVVVQDGAGVHVLNAPSPAATSCLAIAETIVGGLG